MKLTVELQGLASGQADSTKKEGEKVDWAAVWGKDANNRPARAVVYGSKAIALNKSIASKLLPDEVVATKRMVVQLEGSWRTSPAKGNHPAKRTFYADSFNILDGMALENARLRSDASVALSRAEKLRNAGQPALAYELVAQFVANFAGQPLDLSDFIAESAAHDAEFGEVSNEADPEALAVAHFSKIDGIQADNKKTTPVDEEVPEAASDFGGDDPVMGGDNTGEALDQEEAITLVSDNSEDTPETPAPEEKKEAAMAGVFRASKPGSKPFSRTNMPNVSSQSSSKVVSKEDSVDAEPPAVPTPKKAPIKSSGSPFEIPSFGSSR